MASWRRPKISAPWAPGRVIRNCWTGWPWSSESGWDVKRFYKQMVMSATYRQSASETPEKLEKDPGNRLLSRGPRFRMDAEMVRDTALAASGLLSEKMGGPSVKPYQPTGVWEAVAMIGSNTRDYVQDTGERCIAAACTRSGSDGASRFMDIFNAPDAGCLVYAAQRTNTPLQALVTMNDVQWLEAARQLAERAIERAAQTLARLDFLGLLYWPVPGTQAQAILARMLEDFAHTTARTRGCESVDAVGESRAAARQAPAELAAWTLLASAAMNLDAALNKE